MMTMMLMLMMMMMMMMMMAYQLITTSHIPTIDHVGIRHNDEGWEYDKVKFLPYIEIIINITMRGRGQTRQVILL